MAAPPRSLTMLAFAALALPSARAQSWQIPVHGAAVYQRTLESKVVREPDNFQAGTLWGFLPNAGVVLHSDLDRKGERIDRPWLDPRDAFAWACMDLSIDRKKKARFELVGGNRFAACVLEVQYSAVDDGGKQTLEGTFVTDPKGGNGGGAPARIVLSGSMRGERFLDGKEGRVSRLKGHIELVARSVARDQSGSMTWSIDDEWVFERLLAHDDPEFRTRAGRAIEAAVRPLQEELRRKLDREVTPGEDPYHDHQAGDLALLLLALVKGTEDPGDELIQRGYDKLRVFPMSGTYSLSVAILAMEALYTPPGEFRALREGSIDKPMERKLSVADRLLVEKWCTALLENIDTTVDEAYVRRWHYGPSTNWDNSNSQYALLGIYAARLCGIEISPQVWHAASAHWLDVQIADGKPASPSLVTHAQREAQDRSRSSRGTTSRSRRTQPVGWAYFASGPPTGSMTCAGLTGLTLCWAAMREHKIGTAQQRRDIEDAIRGGFLWLSDHLDVRSNPGPVDNSFNWVFYYLYGLERTCELNQLALLGGRDWYFDGAMQLLGQQHKNGSWGGDWDTAFGLLFLKKSALPTFTGK